MGRGGQLMGTGVWNELFYVMRLAFGSLSIYFLHQDVSMYYIYMLVLYLLEAPSAYADSQLITPCNHESHFHPAQAHLQILDHGSSEICGRRPRAELSHSN